MRILHTVDAVLEVARWVGLLARGVAAYRLLPAASPSPAAPSGQRSDVPAHTVAEPRRTFTGLPCYAHRGHPGERRLYHRPQRAVKPRAVLRCGGRPCSTERPSGQDIDEDDDENLKG